MVNVPTTVEVRLTVRHRAAVTLHLSDSGYIDYRMRPSSSPSPRAAIAHTTADSLGVCFAPGAVLFAYLLSIGRIACSLFLQERRPVIFPLCASLIVPLMSVIVPIGLAGGVAFVGV